MKTMLKLGFACTMAMIVLLSANPVQANLIDISELNNIAPLYNTLTASSNPGSADRALDDILEDRTGYSDNYAWISGGENPSSLTLTFSTSYDLTGLRAWISSDVPAGIDPFLDRETASVLFEVSSDGGGNWSSAGTVPDTGFVAAPEDPTAIWSVAEVSGSWTSVNAVRFTFDHSASGSSRVGEIQALSIIPEPSIATLLLVGGLLACRKLRRS